VGSSRILDAEQAARVAAENPSLVVGRERQRPHLRHRILWAERQRIVAAEHEARRPEPFDEMTKPSRIEGDRIEEESSGIRGRALRRTSAAGVEELVSLV
jgi:hypothetical protein